MKLIQSIALVAVAVAALSLGACASKQQQPPVTSSASVGYSK